MNVFGSILDPDCLSVRVCGCRCVPMSVCAKNNNFCQSAGGGIKSHLVTALVFFCLQSDGYSH